MTKRDENREAWSRFLPHVKLSVAEAGGVVAFLQCDERRGIAWGETERAALANLRARLFGTPAESQRPWLGLCVPCNRRAAEAGKLAHTVGVEVCQPCAAKIEQWERDSAEYQERARRRARNARKRERRACRRSG